MSDNQTFNPGCKRILPCNTLDDSDNDKFEANTSMHSWRRDKRKPDAEKVYPVRVIPIEQYVPIHNKAGKEFDLCLHSGDPYAPASVADTRTVCSDSFPVAI